NPVRARLVDRADKWPWSSVRAHLDGTDDGLVSVKPVLDRCGPFDKFIDLEDTETDAHQAFRQAETTGRPVGSNAWIEKLEARTGRALAPQKRGPKPKDGNA
ncbi:MAG: transposase, partial [Cyanobacteria bacterium P01_A01_bin.17]